MQIMLGDYIHTWLAGLESTLHLSIAVLLRSEEEESSGCIAETLGGSTTLQFFLHFYEIKSCELLSTEYITVMI